MDRLRVCICDNIAIVDLYQEYDAIKVTICKFPFDMGLLKVSVNTIERKDFVKNNNEYELQIQTHEEKKIELNATYRIFIKPNGFFKLSEKFIFKPISSFPNYLNNSDIPFYNVYLNDLIIDFHIFNKNGINDIRVEGNKPSSLHISNDGTWNFKLKTRKQDIKINITESLSSRTCAYKYNDFIKIVFDETFFLYPSCLSRQIIFENKTFIVSQDNSVVINCKNEDEKYIDIQIDDYLCCIPIVKTNMNLELFQQLEKKVDVGPMLEYVDSDIEDSDIEDSDIEDSDIEDSEKKNFDSGYDLEYVSTTLENHQNYWFFNNPIVINWENGINYTRITKKSSNKKKFF
jgi:hypothetical protein